MANEAQIIAELAPLPAEATALAGGALRRAGTNEEGRLVLEVDEGFPFTDDEPDLVDGIYALIAARFPQRISDTMDIGGRCVWVIVKGPNGTDVKVCQCTAVPAEQ